MNRARAARATPAATALRAALAALAALAVSTGASGCAGVLVDLAVGSERGRAGVRKHTDEDGVVFLERRARAPDGPLATVVLLHGFGASKEHWTRFIGELPDGLRVLAPDLPGFGETPFHDGERYDLATQSARLHRFLARRSVDDRAPLHLMGNSMGGQLAAVYALDHPGAVRSLVLFDPAGVTPPRQSERARLAAAAKSPVVVESVEEFTRLMELGFVKPPRIPDVVKQHFAEEAARRGPATRRIFSDLHERPAPLAGRLDDLFTPTLVVWGDGDQIIDPSAADVWAAGLKNGDVVIMAGVGHAPMLERPDESAALALVWWARRGVL